MNNETLSNILGEMAYAAKSDVAMLYHDFSREQISEAEEKLDKLIERDTAKKPIDAVVAYCNGMPVVVAGKCPNCCANRTRQDSFCNCGQRLDWSEK